MILSAAFLIAGAAWQLAAGQVGLENKPADSVAVTVRYQVFGRLQFADGSPAVGAQVIATGGEFAFANADGFFLVKASLDPLGGPQALEITANQGNQGHGLTWPLPTMLPGESLDLGVLSLQPTAQAQYQWLPAVGERPGVNGAIRCCLLTEPNAAGDQEILIGGAFDIAGATKALNVARWDGTSWHPMGNGLTGTVHSLCWFDAGTGAGEELFAGGDFGVPGAMGRSLARWDGRTWQVVGGGVQGEVASLGVATPAGSNKRQLIVGGLFSAVGQLQTKNIAAWDGTQWTALGEFPHGRVQTIIEFSDGTSHGDLWVGSNSIATSSSTPHGGGVWRWNGQNWIKMVSFGYANQFLEDRGVHSSFVWDAKDGFGPCLFIGGNISIPTVADAIGVVRWTGQEWRAVGKGLLGAVNSMTVLKKFDGADDVLVAAGYFSYSGTTYMPRLAHWSGGQWSPLDNHFPNGEWHAVAAREPKPGSAGRLFVGGDFTSIGPLGPDYRSYLGAAHWQAGEWSSLGQAPEAELLDLANHDDGSGTGPATFAAGRFTTAGGLPGMQVFKIVDGQAQPLGDWLGGWVYALQSYDDGTGPALYAAGWFNNIGTQSVPYVARWNGSAWETLAGSSGLNLGIMRALAVHDDGLGQGKQLYMGVSNAQPYRWGSSGWQAFGYKPGFHIYCFASFRHPGQDRDFLYAGGYDVNGISDGVWRSIAFWDGFQWNPLGHGAYGAIWDLCVFDDGQGPVLYVGGEFVVAGGAQTAHLGRWDGERWLDPLPGAPDGRVTLVRPMELDGKVELVVGGAFKHMGSLLSSNLVRWDGTAWKPMATSMDLGVNSMIPVPGTPAHAPQWYFGGPFRTSSSQQSHVVGWGRPQ